MNEKDAKGHDGDTTEHQPYRVRLPGFVTEENIGLGDATKRVTYALGIKPCGGCERRAAALNRRFIFTGRAK
jgi:hypothetical protein